MQYGDYPTEPAHYNHRSHRYNPNSTPTSNPAAPSSTAVRSNSIRGDPFSRMLSSLDTPRSKTALSGHLVSPPQYSEHQYHRTGNTTPHSSHNNALSNSSATATATTATTATTRILLTRPESHSLRTTATRNQAVSDRLRVELEHVRQENALLATRYSTLYTKLQKSTERTIKEQRNVLHAEEEYGMQLKEVQQRLSHSETEKSTLEAQVIELNTLKNAVVHLKKEHGAQIFVSNQRLNEITQLKRDVLNEKDKSMAVQTELNAHQATTVQLQYKISTLEKQKEKHDVDIATFTNAMDQSKQTTSQLKNDKETVLNHNGTLKKELVAMENKLNDLALTHKNHVDSQNIQNIREKNNIDTMQLELNNMEQALLAQQLEHQGLVSSHSTLVDKVAQKEDALALQERGNAVLYVCAVFAV